MSQGRLARRVSLAALVTVAALMAAPSGASAAITIGQTFTPTGGNPSGRTWLPSGAPGYAAPSAGVITRWSFEAGGAPPQLKFKVGRPAPGADFTMAADFTIIGESALVTPVANKLNSYSIQIPVQVGDMIGLSGMTAGSWVRVVAGYTYHFKSGDVPVGTLETFDPSGDAQFDLSAVLEPDCDRDGLGDETQDTNTASCQTPAAIPALTCRGQQATIVGTPGNDVRTGTRGRDVMLGLEGDDTLRGLAGNDVICGAKGNDRLIGGKGKDTLLGQKGNDKLKGGPGKDKLSGKKGKDTLKGGGGNDKLTGGGGRDLCIGGKGNDSASKCEVEKSI